MQFQRELEIARVPALVLVPNELDPNEPLGSLNAGMLVTLTMEPLAEASGARPRANPVFCEGEHHSGCGVSRLSLIHI